MKEENACSWLIFDKDGYIGQKLILGLKDQTIYIVSRKMFSSSPKVHPILFRRRIPAIPDYQYEKIFFIYNGQENNLEFLTDFLKKAKRDKAVLYFLSHKDDLTQKLAHMLLSTYDKSYLLLFGDILSSDAHEKYGRTTEALFSQVAGSSLLLDNMGLREVYPVVLTDLLRGISTIVLEKTLSKRTYFLFPEYPFTELSIARMIKKREPLLKIDFRNIPATNNKKHPKKFLEGLYFLSKQYSIEQYVSSFPLPNVIKQERKTTKSRLLFSLLSRRLQKHKRSWIKIVVAVLGLVLVVPLMTSIVIGGVGGGFLFAAKNTLSLGDFVKAKTLSSMANNTFSLARGSYGIDKMIGFWLGKKEWVSFGAEYLSLGQDSASLIRYTADAGEKYSEVESGKSINPQDDLLQATAAAEGALRAYQKIKQQKYFLNSTPLSFFSKSSTDIVDPETVLSSGISALPEMLGINSDKTYLVLFQNNMELRPGGGFIGSYGLLRLKKGRVASFTIHDVYDADGQLKGHIEPPFALRRYLPTPHLYLRDSNFSPDFPKSASSAAMLYQQEMGQTVDGVIAVDQTFVQKLVGLVGPLTVPDYKEVVTANNFYVLTEKHAEKNFFPGSTQKKDLLLYLFNALQLQMENNKEKNIPGLLRVTYESLLEKHILLAFSDPSFEQLLKVDNLASSLFEVPLKNGEINDFFGINEANIGVNKANFFIKRKIEQQVSLQANGEMQEQVEVRYKNTSSGWPGGAYKAYLRFILPDQAKLTGIKIDGNVQKIVPAITDPLLYEAKKFVPPSGLELETTHEEGKIFYGFLLNIPQGAYKTVTVFYSLHFENLDINRFSYNLLIFKQPGTLDDPYSLSVSYPKNYTTSTLFPNTVIQNGQLIYSTHLLHDSSLSINFYSK